MARLARAVFPGVPHHVTQRGNGGQQTFFNDADYELYRDLLAEHAAAARVEAWSWVLMPNHVHRVLVPGEADALRAMFPTSIAAMPAMCMRGCAAPGTSGRAGSAAWPWTRPTSARPCAMWR